MIKFVKLKEPTHERLSKIPVKIGATYDDVINMLLDHYECEEK